MNFPAYYQFFDNAIHELTDMRNQLTQIERGLKFTKCNPIRINPSTGRDCQTDVDLSGDLPNLGPIQTAFDQWIGNLATRFVPPDSTDVG